MRTAGLSGCGNDERDHHPQLEPCGRTGPYGFPSGRLRLYHGQVCYANNPETQRGYTVATAVVQENGRVEITEWLPDGESTSYTSAANLNAAWRHIKNYTLTDFDDELKSEISSGVKR